MTIYLIIYLLFFILQLCFKIPHMPPMVYASYCLMGVFGYGFFKNIKSFITFLMILVGSFLCQFFPYEQGIDRLIVVFLLYFVLSKLINPQSNYYLILIFPLFTLKYIDHIGIRSIIFMMTAILMIWQMTTEKKIILSMGCQSYLIPSLIPICLSLIESDVITRSVIILSLSIGSAIISLWTFSRYHIYKIAQSIIVSLGMLMGATLYNQGQEFWQMYFLLNTTIIILCGCVTYMFSLEKDIRHMGGIWTRVLRFYLLCVGVLCILFLFVLKLQSYQQHSNDYLTVVGCGLIIAHIVRLFLYIFHGSIKTSDIVFTHVKEPPLLMVMSLLSLSALLLMNIKFTFSYGAILTLAVGILIGVMMFFIYVPTLSFKKISLPHLSLPLLNIPYKRFIKFQKIHIIMPIKIILSLLLIGGLLWIF